MTSKSRLQVDPSTHLPGIHSFGELGSFLRGSMADEDSRQLSENMSELASRIEAVISSLRRSRSRIAVAPPLVDLLTALRDHSTLVVGLGLLWRGLYEYAAYLQALNNFRVLIGQWLLGGDARGIELPFTAEDFELVAWRTLGEGLLMIDMYEQAAARQQQDPSGAAALEAPQVERAIQWWRKLRL